MYFCLYVHTHTKHVLILAKYIPYIGIQCSCNCGVSDRMPLVKLDLDTLQVFVHTVINTYTQLLQSFATISGIILNF